MERGICIPRLGLVVLMACTLASGSQAQTNDEVNSAVQFNFSSPGARSLGMGGAFIGLADDATAAYTNPAGLAGAVQISRPEITLEGRGWGYTHTFNDRGSTTTGIIEGEANNDASGLSFISFVYPTGRWTFAIYRHELANFEADFQTQGVTFQSGNTTRQFFPIDTSLVVDIENIGAATAVRLGEDFSLGLGLAYYQFSEESRTNRYALGLPITPANVVNFQTQNGDDSDIAAILGFHWRASEKVRIGGVWRQGAEFEAEAQNRPGPQASFTPLVVPSQFRTPDVYGVGLAFKPADPFTITADWVRVQYSQLSEDIGNLFPTVVTDPDRYEIDDGDEIHLGMEYVFLQLKSPLALRVGGWQDPDHRLRYTGAEVAERIRFRSGSNETHYSAGFGLIFAGGTLELNAAADFSDRVDTTSASLVWRF